MPHLYNGIYCRNEYYSRSISTKYITLKAKPAQGQFTMIDEYFVIFMVFSIQLPFIYLAYRSTMVLNHLGLREPDVFF
jgi:hypothetical protein